MGAEDAYGNSLLCCPLGLRNNVLSLEPAALQSFLYVHLWETLFPDLGILKILL